MPVDGIVLKPGEAGGGVSLSGTRIGYLVTAEQSKNCSVFEFSVAPGFDTGAHDHTRIEESFYVLEGELNLRLGDRVIRGGPGTFAFIPAHEPHSFGNSGEGVARLLVIAAPAGHEAYFDELAALVKLGRPAPERLAELRARYDTIQVSTLTS